MLAHRIARKHGTDKVTTHHYDAMYDKYLEPLRDRPLKMLEIGLGKVVHSANSALCTEDEYAFQDAI